MNEEMEVRALFERVLDGEDDGGMPEVAALKRQGGRLMRRWVLRAASVTAGVVVAAGCVTYGIGRTGMHPAHDSSSAQELAGVASSPSKPPTDMSKGATEKLHAQLLEALNAHLPKDVRLIEGSDPTVFRLKRADGSTTTLGAVSGLQKLGGAPEPCPKYGTDCQKVMLPDGSRGWAWKGLDGRDVTVTLYTLNGQAFGLSDGDSGSKPGTQNERETGAPLTVQQLIALVSQPQVYAALKGAPTDEVTPEPAGSPHRP